MQTYYPALHFNQPQGHAVYISNPVNGELGEAKVDGGQTGGLIKSNVVAMSEA